MTSNVMTRAMSVRQTLLTIGIVIVPTAGVACGELVQSCTFNGGQKEVQVCITDDQVTYDFGPTGGSPELSLSVSVVNAEYTPWPGVGRSIWESIKFHNGSYSYDVSAGFDKLREGQSEPDPAYGGIRIENDGALVADVSCDEGSVDWAYGTEGLYGAKTAAGQCWEDQVWRACN